MHTILDIHLELLVYIFIYVLHPVRRTTSMAHLARLKMVCKHFNTAACSHEIVRRLMPGKYITDNISESLLRYHYPYMLESLTKKSHCCIIKLIHSMT